MATKLERLFENIALHLSAGSPLSALALASRLPIAPRQSLALLSELARTSVLRASEVDGITTYTSNGAPFSKNLCPGCARSRDPAAPLCLECLLDLVKAAGIQQHELEQILGEHAVLCALSTAQGEEADLSTLASQSDFTVKECEDFLNFLAGRQAVALSSDPSRISFRAPLFAAPQSFLKFHKGVLVAQATTGSREQVLSRLRKHFKKGVIAAAVLYLVVLTVGYLQVRSTTKAAANAYWRLFFSVKEHEALLSRYLYFVPELDTAQMRTDLDSMAELDVVPRLMRDQVIHNQLKAAMASSSGNPAAEEGLTLLSEFERRFSDQERSYNLLAREHAEAFHSLPARCAGFIIHDRVLYDPLPADAWKE